MNRDELEKRNVGENLDTLMNLDPRGYGVCRILYAGSRKATGEPLTMHAAQTLVDAVKPGDLVYILTGFVLLPHKVPEMDGMVSSMLLARALVLAFRQADHRLPGRLRAGRQKLRRRRRPAYL